MKFLLYAVVACACSWSVAQEIAPSETPSELGRRVPLPPAYSGEAVETHEYGIVGPPFRFRFAIAEDWTVGTKFIMDPDFGDAPLAYEHATREETWEYGFDSSPTVTRDDTFGRTGRGAVEGFVSPMALVRPLRWGLMDGEDWSIDHEGNSTVLDIRRKGKSVINRLFFDRPSGRLERHQIVLLDGRIRMDWAFEDWVPVGNTGEAPTRIVTRSYPAGEGTGRATTAVLTNLMAIDPITPPERPVPRADATIIDKIDGVTRRADGTSLGAITPADKPGPAVPAGPDRQWLNSRFMMTAGVVLILLAGAVLGWRRWKGA